MRMVAPAMPAMAVSDFTSTQVTWSTSLPTTHRAYEVADIVVRLVKGLVDNKAVAGGLLMPVGVGLNVNVPDFAAGAGATQQFKFTKVGKATAYAPAFFEKLSDSPLAVGAGVNYPLPGISLAPGGTTLPGGSTIPADTNPASEQNVLNAKGYVTLSPVEGVPQARRSLEDALRLKLNALAQ